MTSSDSFLDKLSDKVWEKVAAVFLGICFLAGNSVAGGAFAETFYSKRMLVIYLLYLSGIYFTFRFVLYHLRMLITKIMNSNIEYRFSYKIQFIVTFLGLLFCWSPYVLLRYPAGFEMDAYFQIADFLEGTMTAHWSPASSAYMGIFVLIGQKLFDDSNIGIFYCILQLIIGSAIFSYCVVVLRKLDVPVIWTYISIIVFVHIPVYPGYITSVVKDAPFAYMVTLFVVLFAQVIYLDNSIWKLIGLFLSGFLMCILRNNGIFILFGIVIALIIRLVVKRKTTYVALFVGVVSARYIALGGVC